MDSETKVVNIRIPDELLRILDTYVENHSYRSRSEAIRDLAREYILQHRGDENS